MYCMCLMTVRTHCLRFLHSVMSSLHTLFTYMIFYVILSNGTLFTGTLRDYTLCDSQIYNNITND